MPKAGVVGGIFRLLLVGAIVYFSLGFNQQTCEVCMDFQGRTACRTAAAATEHGIRLDDVCRLAPPVPERDAEQRLETHARDSTP